MRSYLFIILSVLLFTNFQCQDDPVLPDSVTISGAVYTASQDAGGDPVPLEGVDITLYSDGEFIAASTNGSFEFTDLEPGINYTLVPEKYEDNLTGVSTFDVALLESYLNDSLDLNIRQMIAADMDRSYHVNDNDLAILRECLLTPMMMYCLDYRFYLEDCTSLSQKDMINDIQFNELASDRLDLKIMIIKSGDLNAE